MLLCKTSNEKLFVADYDLSSENAFASNTLIVLAVQSEPFIFKVSSSEWSGYCVDILREISSLVGVNFLIKEAREDGKIYQLTNESISNMTNSYKWSGAMGDLLNNVNKIHLNHIS